MMNLDKVREFARAADISVCDFKGKGTPVEDALSAYLSGLISPEMQTLVKERLKIGHERYDNQLRCVEPFENWPREFHVDVLQEIADAVSYSVQAAGSFDNMNDEKNKQVWTAVAARLSAIGDFVLKEAVRNPGGLRNAV